MERKIGEIFEYNGEWYQCLPEILMCNDCAFKNDITCKESKGIRGECQRASRQRDGVIFRELKKLGEPCHFGKKLMQTYKLFTKPVTPLGLDCFTIRAADDSSIEIEIKQNKEDMEENKLNLKPFDLEAAIQGKPVCTRDGRKARIICFDRICGDDYYKIVACVTAFDGDFEEVLSYGIDGYIVDSQNPKDEDLMMLPEKKEGWINIYKKSNDECYFAHIYDTKALAEIGKNAGCIATVRIEWEE